MIKYIRSSSPPDDLLRRTYPQIRRDFGAVVEPFALHAPAPQLLVGLWLGTRETELVGYVRRSLKETVAAAVSEINQCPYCVDAHTMMLDSLHGLAVKRASAEQADEATTRRVMAWAKATRSPGDALLQTPPFSQVEAPEMIGTAGVFHYVNRMVTIFLSESPLPSNRRWLKGLLKKAGSGYFARAVRRQKIPGDSLQLLPEAPLPADFGWAAASPTVSGAFARWAAVMEAAGQSALSANVRELVSARLADWHGEAPGLSRAWVEPLIATLPAADRPAARLALLAALAPYQIGDDIIAAFRAQAPEDKHLIEVTAWASFTAARHIVGWLTA